MGDEARIELTEDLVDYTRRSVVIEAKKRCPRSMDWDDIV